MKIKLVYQVAVGADEVPREGPGSRTLHIAHRGAVRTAETNRAHEVLKPVLVVST